MATPDAMLILGVPALRQLPVVLRYAGRTLFEGTPPVQVVAETPTHPVGTGVQFATGTPQQQKQIVDMLIKHQHGIFEWSGKFGLFRDYPEDIPLTSQDPVQVKPYRVPVGLHQPFQEILQEYLDRRIVEEAASPYSSPAFLVPKHGAKPEAIASKRYRMCCDYREINKITEDVMFPAPDVQQLLDALGSHNEYFATIDLRMGYHHIPLTADGKRKTAFTTPQGQYQFRVMSFGMKRSPRVFQRALHLILGNLVWRACLVYLDDVIVFGRDFTTFLANLTEVVDKLVAAGASISLDKSTFLATQVKYLGFVIDRNTCRPAPETIETISNYPRPTTMTELLRFIGMASYVRQYIPKFASYEQQLRAAIPKKRGPLQWDATAEAAFQHLRTALAKDIKLRRFDPGLYTEVQTDASATTVGAVLLQGTSPHDLQVLQYASTSLKPHERRYSNTERELYAIKWAVTQKFRPYLEGRTFVVATDHQALLHELRLNRPSQRVIRFKLALAGYQYTIRHIKGAANVAADALSRITPMHAGAPTYADIVRAAPPKACQGTPPRLSQGGGEVRSVPVQCVNQGDLCANTPDVRAPHRLAPIRPLPAGSYHPNSQQEVRTIIEDCHQQLGHAGWRTVWQTLKTRVQWPKLRQQVFSHLKHCQPCILYSVPTTVVGTALQPITSTRPAERLCVDVVPMPRAGKYTYLLLAVDHFSKAAFARPAADARSHTLLAFLRTLFLSSKKFEIVHSDAGTQFTAKKTTQFLATHGVRQHVAGPRHHESNGALERLVRTLQEILAKAGAKDDDWPTYLPAAIQAYNRRPHSVTGAAPIDVFLGTAHPLPLDDRLGTSPPPLPSMERVAHTMATKTAAWQRASALRRPDSYTSGTEVFHIPRRPTTARHARGRRFLPRRYGPYVIIEEYPFNRYLCTDGVSQYLLPAWELQAAPQNSGGGE
ncbi:MAG: reverse transcriptase domain-containing protein [Chromatiaceae bacterium]|nr:reverse transcriptase domain-containing protein [Candidatus Thioaporhodococcus sediminis]